MHVIEVLIWGFGECWRFLTVVCYLNLELDIYLDFEGAKNLNVI